MGKTIQFLMVLMVAVMLPLAAFCQDGPVPSVFDPGTYYVSLAALVGAVMTITQFLKKVVVTEGITTKLLSWGVGLALSVIGYVMKLGIFEAVEWYWILIYALSAGLVGNSIFDLSIIEGILSIFEKDDNP